MVYLRLYLFERVDLVGGVSQVIPNYTLCVCVGGSESFFCCLIFRSRDTPFTELMDYMGATLVVAYNLYCLCHRVLLHRHILWRFIVGILLALFFSLHFLRIAFIHFDYGWNMTVCCLDHS